MSREQSVAAPQGTRGARGKGGGGLGREEEGRRKTRGKGLKEEDRRTEEGEKCGC